MKSKLQTVWKFWNAQPVLYKVSTVSWLIGIVVSFSEFAVSDKWLLAKMRLAVFVLMLPTWVMMTVALLGLLAILRKHRRHMKHEREFAKFLHHTQRLAKMMSKGDDQ